jgi:predicted dehydrogenase
VARKFARDRQAHGLRLRAAASRDGGRAAAFAASLGIPGSYAGYQALPDDPEADVIYIALHNHMHAEWSIRAARAGKHVLGEKPAALYEAGNLGRRQSPSMPWEDSLGQARALERLRKMAGLV